MRERKCPFCGHTNSQEGTDCGQFFATTCEKCGKGYIYAKPKRADDYHQLIQVLHADLSITDLMYATYD